VKKKEINYTYAIENDIEIRVNLEDPKSMIEYRIKDYYNDSEHGEWIVSPFQRADVLTEIDALKIINNYLDNIVQ
jgi:hypothetical protein